MHKGHTFLAVIPARGGSKGIPNKNIVVIHNKPLIQYTIETALQSKYLDRIIVSTDNQEIANTATSIGAEVPFLRPAHLAQDNSKTIDVLVHTIKHLKALGTEYDFIVLLQPTQPLREAFHIDQAIEQLIEHNANALVSVSEVKEHPILMRTIENGKLKSLLGANSTVRRQDFPAYYKVNGSIYINKLDNDFNEDISLNDNPFPYVMDSYYDLDIDTEEDLIEFQRKLQHCSTDHKSNN